jgi:hypothetical protein
MSLKLFGQNYSKLKYIVYIYVYLFICLQTYIYIYIYIYFFNEKIRFFLQVRHNFN